MFDCHSDLNNLEIDMLDLSIVQLLLSLVFFFFWGGREGENIQVFGSLNVDKFIIGMLNVSIVQNNELILLSLAFLSCLSVWLMIL